MNNFTKEELEEIQEIARHCRKQSVETKHNLTSQVKCKAEYFIANYRDPCKHEYGEVNKNDCTVQCVKCKDWF